MIFLRFQMELLVNAFHLVGVMSVIQCTNARDTSNCSCCSCYTHSPPHLVKIITVKLFTGNDFMKWSFFPEISLSLTQRNTGNVCLYSMQVLHAATVVKKKSYCFLIQPIEGKGHGIKQQKKWDIWESIHRHQSLITVVSSDTRSPRP